MLIRFSHSIPTGNVDDEGTLFALGVANITYEQLPPYQCSY